MSKRSGMYKSDKRKKELKRQKKQEEKRLKRLNSKTLQDSEGTESMNIESESSVDNPQETNK